MPLRQSVRLALIVGALFLVSACATTRVATAPARPAPPSTAPATPAPLAPGYEETGDASWYGHPYHGRKAASGETYDMNQMTAAHRTLPFGTRVRVESLVDGSSVEVRINDRGPFKDDKRIIDLSYAAGKLLGVVGPGVIPVKMRVVSLPGAQTAAAPAPPAMTAPAAASPPAPAPVAPAAVAAKPVSAAPLAAIPVSAPAAPPTASAAAAPSASPSVVSAPVAGQTPIAPPAQAPPPLAAETAPPRPETVPRVEAAVRAPSTPAPPAPAPSPAPSAPAAPGVVTEGWSVQLGAYASEGSAKSLRDTLVRSWPDARVQRTEVSGRTLWRVRVGNYASRRDADEAAKRLAASGYRAMVVESARP